MPIIEYFPYMGPNRRSDKTVVEITLKFGSDQGDGFPVSVPEARQLLIDGGICTKDETFPRQPLPEESKAGFSSLLAQTALLLQRKTGHRVSFYSILPVTSPDLCIALVEHEHCDVGMTAVKLAWELLSGKRRFLKEPFEMFSRFAQDRLLPLETEAIIKAAQRRDIPCTHLERQPFSREDFDELTGGKCIQRNGLLMLGHGVHQHVLDGTYCLDKPEDFKDLLNQHRMLSGDFDPDSPEDILIDRLFPDKDRVRMPIIAVTGTNGKTTTSRMVAHILLVSGRKPGLVCTDGIYLNGQLLEEKDQSTRIGHLKVLASKLVDVAVLETHHLGILGDGFSSYWCDIAICLNVTEDHLGTRNIDTLEQMAEVKKALIERARQAAILNADDPYCMAMLDSVSAGKTCLVSMGSDIEKLRARVDNENACFCVLESIGGEQWMVIYDQENRLPLMTANSIPATFDGTAGFNISNAMHAVVAGYMAGIGLRHIKKGMESFNMSFENTPGRLNFYEGHPFRVLMDFAHNTDGMRQLSEFVERLKVSGRKLLMFQAKGDLEDKYVKDFAAAAAGHFDHFVCRTHPLHPGPDKHKTPGILKAALLEASVGENQITVTTDPVFAVNTMLKMGAEGDLLVFAPGSGQPRLDAWDQIISFKSRTTGQE